VSAKPGLRPLPGLGGGAEATGLRTAMAVLESLKRQASDNLIAKGFFVVFSCDASSVYRGDRMAKKTKRKPNAAFMKPVTPSETLAEVVGGKPMPRTEVTKKLWAYIKKNGLQDKKNRRMINADAKLKAVFGGKSSVNMFAMTKLVSKHLK
jgi:chromatin remodeling complex protein RSC6